MKINQLELPARETDKMRAFYSKLCLLDAQEESLQIGETSVQFFDSQEHAPYHIAFNIRINRIDESLEHVKQLCEILEYEGNEVVDHVAWSARAFYFFDPEGNILEFIFRMDSPYGRSGAFRKEDVLNVSEWGLVLSDVSTSCQRLIDLGLEVFSGDIQEFAALGSNDGLLICVQPNRNWMPTEIPSEPVDSKAVIELNDKKLRIESHSDGTIEIQLNE